MWKLVCLHYRHIDYISINYSSEIRFHWQIGGTFIQTLVEIFKICKDQKLRNLFANIVHGETNNVFEIKSKSICQINPNFFCFSPYSSQNSRSHLEIFPPKPKKISASAARLLGCFSMSGLIRSS